MEEIKVGDYIRTPSGDIGIVTNTELIGPEIFTGTKYLVLAPEGIKKHSSNILDLIEIGDIVETFDVLHNDIVYIWNEDMLKALKEDIENGIGIKSIVTHEQFNSIKYEVI